MAKIISIRNFYFLSIYMVMASIFGLSFTWSIPQGLFLLMGSLASLLYLFTYGRSVNPKIGICLTLFFLWYALVVITLGGDVLLQTFIQGFNFLIVYSVIALSNDDKAVFLKFISRVTSIILCISLIAWLLFLSGVPLPHTAEFLHDDDYHTYINYYFFVISPRDYIVLPRFMGVFKEPGHMASICVLLIIANLKNGSRSLFDIIVLSLSLVLSFSLAGWVVMGISLLLMSIIDGRHRLIKVLGVTVLFAFLIIGFRGNENTIVYRYIFSRLEYDEEIGIAGNNRTNVYFDTKYEQFKSSSDVWFGISSELRQGEKWTTGCSGWRVAIVHHGYIGFLLMNLILFAYYYVYRSKYGLVFLIAYLLLNYIRAYFINPYWLYIFLLTIPLLALDESKSSIC